MISNCISKGSYLKCVSSEVRRYFWKFKLVLKSGICNLFLYNLKFFGSQLDPISVLMYEQRNIFMKSLQKVCRSLLLDVGCWWCQEGIVIPSPRDGVLSPSQREGNLQVLLMGEMCFRCVAQIWWKHPQIHENKQSNQIEFYLLKTLLWYFNNIKKKKTTWSSYVQIYSYS